jgi:LuxR family transcriptional regulator, maltose regulon positive regulatory protein
MTTMIDDSQSTATTPRLVPAVRAGRPAAPALERDGQRTRRLWVMMALLLGAIARETVRDQGAVRRVPRAATGDTSLTHGETRVLHYLPTNLSAREIGRELCVSVNTVKTHQRHLYQKLGARSRSEAVQRARALGLLAPSSPGR